MTNKDRDRKESTAGIDSFPQFRILPKEWLELIIKKLDDKSFFSMIQTYKSMVINCRDAKMTFTNNYEVFYRQSISNGKEKLLEKKKEEPKVTNTNISVFPSSMPWIKCIDPECLRRSRLSKFTLHKNDPVSSICRFLAEMEITCSEIVATSTNATAASIFQLLLLLKLERISLDSHSSDRYKALHQSKTLKSVAIWMYADDTKEILPRIISTSLSNSLSLSRNLILLLVWTNV